MSTEVDLLSEDYDIFQAALVAAVRSAASGERKLLDALGSVQDEELAAGIVSALGEVDGPESVAVLRDIVVQPTDPLGVRAIAVIAVAKRQGVAASDVLLACVNDSDEFVQKMALIALASVGDERAWHGVMQWLQRALSGRDANPPNDMDDRTLTVHSDVLAAVCYLARHAADSWEKQQSVVRMLRSRWDRLYGAEQRWLSAHWSACDPSQPESFTKLDPTWFADWISGPMFGALYLEGSDG